MRIIITLLLLTGVKASAPDDSKDPSGWGSYYVTESHQLGDPVDVVDPSGWNYDRQTKDSVRENERRKNRMVNICKSILEEGDFDSYGLIENSVEDSVKSKIETLFTKEANVNDNIAFVRRFISILLDAADLHERTATQENDYVSSVIEINTSREQLEKLIHFSNSKVNVSLRELDFILSSSIHKKYIPVLNLASAIEKTLFLVSQKEIWLPFFLGFVVLGILRLLVTSRTTSSFVKSLLILIFCLGYVIEYYRMYKVFEIRQKVILENHPEVPSSCNPANRFWLTSLIDSIFSSVSFNKNDECEQYMKAALLDPLVEVSPIRVLSSILTDFIVHPFGKIGTAVAAFATAILGGLPIQFGWIVWIVSCIAVFLLIALAIVLLINGSIQVRSLLFGVNISRNEALSVTNTTNVPEIASVPARVSSPQLERVAGIENPVVIDAKSLGTLLLRAQSNVALYHSGIEELVQTSEAVSPSRSCDEKLVSRNTEARSLKVCEESESLLNTYPESSGRETIDMQKEKKSDLKTSHNESIVLEERNLNESVVPEERNLNETVHQEGNKFVKMDKVNDSCTKDIVENVNNVEITEID